MLYSSQIMKGILNPMKRTFTYQITSADAGHNIEYFLKEQGFSNQNIIDLKKMPESILVNDVWKHVNYSLQPLDTLKVCMEETASSQKIVPVELPLDIIYEDEDLLVVNKPADMPIHPSMGNYENTLANAVAWYYHKQNIPFVFRCINRLDRNTSGLTIIAKHMISANILSQMVAEREIHREYLAIVQDKYLPDMGIVYAPIGRKEGSTIERTIDFINGDRAITQYQVLGRENGYAFVSLKLETGRTHQIRVHMKYMKCPLVGDSLYNSKESSYVATLSDVSQDTRILKRQALHSAKLEFIHPLTKKPLCFTQKLPDDMTNFLIKNMSFTYEEFQ